MVVKNSLKPAQDLCKASFKNYNFSHNKSCVVTFQLAATALEVSRGPIVIVEWVDPKPSILVFLGGRVFF